MSGTQRICNKCKKHVSMLINGRCVACNPFGACMFCGEGDFRSKPAANWQNRWVCDKCGKEVSR